MDFSQVSTTSGHLAVSHDGAYTASIQASRLIIRSALDCDIMRSITLDPEINAGRISWIRFSPRLLNGIDDPPCRVLVADQDSVKVFDVQETAWSATIRGADAGVGRIGNVEFGRNSDELLIFPDFNVKVVIWSIKTRQSIEMRDPKYLTKGFSFRPSTGHFALLNRPAGHDRISLYAPSTYRCIKSIEIPTTDAQNVKWSPCGRWISVVDAASEGTKVYIYTADGHLFRTFNGAEHKPMEGLGVKSVEWSPTSKFLAVGTFENRVTLLSNFTFTPAVFLDHTSTIKLPGVPVWQESVSPSSERSYVAVTQPLGPPLSIPSPNEPNPKVGVSIIGFSADGNLVATRNDTMPTSIWIWSLESLSCVAILVQHSHIKSISWHPTRASLLLVHCVSEEGVIYLWDKDWEMPLIINTPFEKCIGKSSASWIYGDVESRPSIVFHDSSRAVVGYLGNSSVDVVRLFDSPTSLRQSVGTHNPGLSPQGQTLSIEDESLSLMNGEVDDTFIFRKHIAVPE